MSGKCVESAALGPNTYKIKRHQMVKNKNLKGPKDAETLGLSRAGWRATQSWPATNSSYYFHSGWKLHLAICQSSWVDSIRFVALSAYEFARGEVKFHLALILWLGTLLWLCSPGTLLALASFEGFALSKRAKKTGHKEFESENLQ